MIREHAREQFNKDIVKIMSKLLRTMSKKRLSNKTDVLRSAREIQRDMYTVV